MTPSALFTRVLQKLRVIEPGETEDPDDTQTVSDKYDEVYQELNNKGYANWGSAGNIPTTHSNHVIDIVASRCADDFYVDEGRLQRLLVEEEKALRKLNEIEHQPYVSTSPAVMF